MNCEEAINVLNIKSDYTEKQLRHAYYRHSLKYHPDKNSSEDATEKFRQGKYAYEFLISHKNLPQLDEDEDGSYIAFFRKCMKYMIPELERDDKFINNTLKTLIDSCKSVTLKTINNMNKDRAFKVYTYLTKYKDIFNLDDELNKEILDIINKKISSDNIVILNPDINDLIEDKIYKYSTEYGEYYIPLWHPEITYDISGNDLILQCVPELPKNIFIDNYNNLHITVQEQIKKIIDEEKLVINVGKKVFEINSRELKICKTQTHIIKNSGILLAQYDDLYDTSKRGDIFIYISLS